MRIQARDLKMCTLVAVLSLAIGELNALPGAATTFDAAADFSASSNPNGVWSYGFSTGLGGPVTLYDSNVAPFFSPLSPWVSSAVGLNPVVLHNGTASPVTIISFTQGPGELSLHPHVPDFYSLIRWTAPAAGAHALGATFTGLDFVGPTTTDVHVLHNGVSLFDDFVNLGGNPNTAFFSTPLAVSSGDTIDFAIGNGGNGSLNDTTGLAATISAVPEPSSLIFLGSGLAVLAAWRWNRAA